MESSRNPSARPRMLEIKTACDPIHIYDFAGKIQTRDLFTLHGLYIYLGCQHTPGGNKFFFKCGFPFYLERMIGKSFE